MEELRDESEERIIEDDDDQEAQAAANEHAQENLGELPQAAAAAAPAVKKMSKMAILHKRVCLNSYGEGKLDFATACTQWNVVQASEVRPGISCTCSHKPITNVFTIRNKETMQTLSVGCECVKHFTKGAKMTARTFFEQLHTLQTTEWKNGTIPTASFLDYSQALQFITPGDCYFLKKMRRMRKAPTDKQQGTANTIMSKLKKSWPTIKISNTSVSLLNHTSTGAPSSRTRTRWRAAAAAQHHPASNRPNHHH